jgi:hypothetical protein
MGILYDPSNNPDFSWVSQVLDFIYFGAINVYKETAEIVQSIETYA